AGGQPMGWIETTTGCSGIAVLAMVGLAAGPPDARASVSVVRVPCDSSSLANAILGGNVQPATIRLAPHCVYDITGQLPQVTGNVTLIGGPSTTIRHDPGTAANYRLLDVATTGTLRVLGVFLRNGNPAGDGGAIRNAGRLVLV